VASWDSSSRRKMGKLPQPRVRPGAPAPEGPAEETLAQVAEPEPEVPQEPDPPMCAKCMKSAAENGSPFVGGTEGA
jgi:hypothetical protein